MNLPRLNAALNVLATALTEAADKDPLDQVAAQPSGEGFNLDDEAEIHRFLKMRPDKQKAIYGKSTETLVNYGKKRLEAMKLRKGGDIERAMKLERQLDDM